MTILSQPPPDAPAPPPSDDTVPSSRNSWGIQILVLLSLIGLAAVIVAPMVRRQHKKAIETSANNHLRQIGLCLFEFETEYGKFPDASTIDPVRKATGALLPLGTKSSNDYFRQLFAAGIAQSENFFYAEIPGSRKADNRMDATRVLEKGECCFTYVLGLSSTGNPSCPICVTPVVPQTDRFDPKPFVGKAEALRLDNSVTLLSIDNDGQCQVNGKNLFDPTNPIWDGKPPVIAWPDL